MAAFVGVKEDMSSATFVLADTVDPVKGGQCAPSPSSCSLLQLKPGQEAHVDYAPQSRRPMHPAGAWRRRRSSTAG